MSEVTFVVTTNEKQGNKEKICFDSRTFFSQITFYLLWFLHNGEISSGIMRGTYLFPEYVFLVA